jgi:hypothetical protein
MFPRVNQPEPETDHSLPSSPFIVSLMVLEVNQNVVSVDGMIWNSTLELTLKDVSQSCLR